MTATMETPAPAIPGVGAQISLMGVFDALPMGAQVSTGTGSQRTVWERVEDRSDGQHMWRNTTTDSLPIRGGNFSGAVTSGETILVSLPGVPEVPEVPNVPEITTNEVKVGDVLLDDREGSAQNAWVVVGLDRTREVDLMEFRHLDVDPQWRYARMTYSSRAFVRRHHRYPVTPEWASVMPSLADVLLRRDGQTPMEQTAVPPALLDDLREYAVGNDANFLALLARHGINTTAHTTRVEITGTTAWTPAPSVVLDQGVVTRDFVINEVEDEVTVSWIRSVMVEKQGFGCTCDQVDRDDLTSFLPPSYEAYDFEVECGA